MDSSFKNMFLSLTCISLLAGAALSAAYSVTKEPITLAQNAKQQAAVKEVLPAFARLDDPVKVKIDALSDSLQVYKAYDEANHFVGAAVESLSENGFGGAVKLMVGFDGEGNIVNYAVLEQKETPGLGTQMGDWFRPQGKRKKSLVETVFGFEVAAAERNSSIIGKNPATAKLTVSKDGGDVDAITAATISSRAFLEAVRNAYSAYSNNPDYKPDAGSGATGRGGN